MNRTTRARFLGVAAGTLLLLRLSEAKADAQGSVVTDGGLRLSLTASGRISGLARDGVEYASEGVPSGFAYRELPSQATDAAPNGSFESGSARPDGWSWSNTSSGSWTWDHAVAVDGSRSLRVDVPLATPKRSPTLQSSRFAIRPGTPYTVSWRARTSSPATFLDVYVVEVDSQGRVFQRGLRTVSTTRDWEARSLTFESGPAAAEAFFRAEIFNGTGTAWLDDVEVLDLFAGRSPTPLEGTVAAEDGRLTQTANVDGLRLESRFTSVGSAIRVDSTLTDSRGSDRAIELTFRLPLEIPGWSWEQDPSSSVAIAAGIRYENLDSSFGAQSHSVYPFAAVRGPEAAFVLATPMVAQMNRFRYDTAGGFRVTWDFGLSAAAAKTPSRADFSFWIFATEPRWGFRAAVEAYQILNPTDFASPFRRQGAWALPAGGEYLEDVSGFRDFGWLFLEGVSDIEFGNENGLLVYHYVDPSGYFRNFPGLTVQPSYDVLVSALQSDASGGTGTLDDNVPRSEMALATINSSPFDPNGRYQVFAHPYFWYGSRLQIFPVSPDPDIPAPSMWSVLNQYSLDGRLRTTANFGDRLDGIFLDDISSTFAGVENHRRELWAYTDAPLSFSWETRKVVLFNGFSIAEFCEAFRSRAAEKGLSLMGSLNPGVYAWFAPYLDVLGGETQGADTLERSYVRRVLTGGRTWSNLFVPLARLAPDGAEVLAYLRQGLFLGYFPGFNGAYWSTRAAYERDRALFQQYIPLIRTVSEAGWRPITGATVSDGAVLAERFDDGRSDVFYLTAQNTSGAAKTVTITLDGVTLGLQPGAATASELVHGRTPAVSRSGLDVRITDTVAPGEALVYRIAVPRIALPDRLPTRRVEPRR